VTALGRRPLDLAHPKLTAVVCDLSRPETYAGAASVDEVFCCLGTTIKQAGSEEAFRQVDYEYPLAVAQAVRPRQYLIVTAVGADANSTFFYNRVKGEVEEALRKLSFAGGLKIFRPSMLLGERAVSRPKERLGGALLDAASPLFLGALRRYRPIAGAAVARAMWNAARREPAGTAVYEGPSLFDLAKRT